MTIDREKLRKMHGVMQQNGYTQDYATFEKKFVGNNNYANRKKVYDLFSQNGADVGSSYNDFMNRLQAKPIAKKTSIAQKAQQIANEYNEQQEMRNSAGYKNGQNMWGAKEGVIKPSGDWRKEHPTIAKIHDTISDVAESVGDYFGNIGKNTQVTTGGATAPAKPFVKGTKEFTDKRHEEVQRMLNQNGTLALTKKDSEMTPLERAQASRLRKGMQTGLAKSTAEEMRRNNNPIMSSKIGRDVDPTSNELLMQLGTDKAKQARIKQQHEDDATQLAYQGVGQNLGNDIFSEVDKGIEQAKKESIAFMNGALNDGKSASRLLAMQNDQISQSVFNAAQGQESTEKIQKAVGDSVMSKVNDYFSRPEVQKNILDSAAKMNMNPEVYLQQHVMPSLMQYAKDAVSHRKLENEIPKSFWEYLAKNASNSILGMMVQLDSQTKENRQLRQQALAVSEGMEEMPQMTGHKGTDYYKAGLGSRFLGTAANMALDSGPLAAIGTLADGAVSTGARLIVNGLEKAGIKNAAKLTAREAAFKAANMTTAQKVASGLLNGIPRSALNLGGYSAITSALGQASTGDDTSLAAVASAGWEGFKHGATTGSMFGVSGALMRPWVQRYGITGKERTASQRNWHGAQKIGAEATALGVEAGTMMVADNLTSDKEISMAQFLEDGVMVMSFKLGEPKNYKHIGSALYGLTHNTSNSPITLTQDEKNELMNSVSGKNLMDIFSDFNKVAKSYPRVPSYGKAYSDFMNDPEVSRNTKEKVNAALGVPSQNFKLSQRSVNDVKNKQILEYASDGTLLSRTSYKNAEQRRDILFRQKTERDNMHVWSLLGYAKLKARDVLGDNGQITPMAVAFMKEHGYDLSKEPTDAENAKIIADIKDPQSNLHRDWEKYADEHQEDLGLTDEIKTILSKDPLKRTDDEVAKIKEYRNALEAQLFPDSKPNPEQAQIQGRTIADDNNLGSEKPNTEVVVNTLNYLRQAENDLAAAYDSSDNFREGVLGLAEQLGLKPQVKDLKSVLDAIQSTGLVNPQIYGMLADSSGKFMVGEADLEPFSRYMMALARAQGMQGATAEAIEENANNYSQDWSYHGTLNGVSSINFGGGSDKVLYVDYNGKEYLVGSGDVSFGEPDQYMRRRGKEDVGDMLVCLDTETGEMAYLPAKDVYYSRESTPEELKETRKQQLQQINSVPYNQAAQEQAAAEAAKPKTEEKPVENAGQKGTDTSGNQMEQPQQTDKDYRDKIADLGIMSIDDSPVGMITNNPKNGKSGALTKVQETLIERKVGSVLDNPNSTISNLHDAIVFEMNTGDRSSANATTLDAIYKVFTAFKEGKLSKDDVLNFVKEQFYGESNNPLRVALEAKRNGETVILNDGKGGTDNMGNVLNSDGSIHTEKVNSLEEIKDEEFDNNPTRSVELPQIPSNVANAIGTGGKPVIIKKNIFKKNYNNHLELDADDSRAILQEALYNPNLVGQTQPIKRPSYKVAIKTGDKNSIVVLDVYDDKKQVEIVGWRRINEKGLAKMQRQAEREGGQFLILSPKDGSAAALSALPYGLSSGGKDTNNSSNDNGLKETLTFEDGSDVPVDANGEPDFMKMTPEQGVEVYKTLFPRTYEAEIDNTIKMLEADLKKVQKATPKSSGVMARAKEQAEIDKAVGLAEAQLARANEIKKTMTAKKVSETVGTAEAEPVEGANQAGSVASEKFNNSPRLVGNKRTRTLADGKTKVRGHYEIVSAESLTPSHDAMNGYKKSEGFPVDENGRTVNDRDYEHDKAAQVNTDQIASHYNGQAIDAVPVVSDEGIVYDGNGRTMAGQKAAKDGTDAEYIGDLMDNAENFGFTREQIENSGIEHPRLVLVTDERLPYDTQTFAKFNKNEKKTQSNTEQAVAKAKTLTADEVGAIVAEIDGNGSLEAFFNNPKAINDLIKTLVSKGVIGQNEVAELMEGTDRLSPQGKEMVKNILLGSIFKPETIRMLGIDSAIKNKAVAGIRAVMDNLKLGDYSLRDEIDQAIQLLYEARQKGDKVDTLLRTEEMFDENAADRYPSVSQMMALALEGKVADFRDLLDEYNRNASARNTGEGHLFGEAPTKEEFVKEFLDYKKWVDYDTRGNQEAKASHDVSSVKDSESKTSGGNGEKPESKPEDGVKAEKKKPTTADPMEAMKKAVEDYRQEQTNKAAEAYKAAKESGDEEQIAKTAKELKHLMDENMKEKGFSLAKRQAVIAMIVGRKEAETIDKPFEEMDSEEREFVASKNPLTESEIRELTPAEDKNLIEDAVDYVNGNHGPIQKLAYLKIYKDVRNRHENAADNSGAKDGTQLASSNHGSSEELGLGTGRESGRPSGELDRGTGAEGVSELRTGGENREGQPDLPSGERGNSEGEGDSSRLGGLSARDSESKGSSNDGGDGTALRHDGGREGGNGNSEKNARRKPTAKQGTTWRGRSGEEIKKNVEDKKAAALAAIAQLKKLKYGKGGSGNLGSMELLTPEQMEYLPTVANAIKDYGMAIIDEGIYKVKDWVNRIRETFKDGLKDCGFTDSDIDHFIKEMWNSKMEMDGETHTIADWCSIYENATLKKKLGGVLDEKRQKQMEVENVPVKVGDRKNIEETLPFLLPQQQEDVYRAETQFFGNEHADREHAYGKGYMFTNGTGTGKTYTGLGIAKRLVKQGKKRILFVTPSQKKVSDWIKDGKNLDLDIRDLDSWAKERGTTATTESGEGCVITTFANFGLNKKLLETEWDAVIYDESHRIMENKNGAETARSMQHYKVTNRDESHCFLRLQDINPHYQKMQDAAERFAKQQSVERKKIKEEYMRSHPSATTKDVINATHKMMPKDINTFSPADGQTFPELGKIYQEFTEAKNYYYKEVEPQLKQQAKDTWKNTKTVFLSATPFNTRENLDYAEGYIFKYPEEDESGMSGRTRFYLDHFGAAYKYRYHRLEQSISNPDAVSKQEVAFSDYLQNNLGTMSGRIIDSPYDYSRDFPTAAPDHAENFNNAVQDCLHTKHLYSAYQKTIGDYNYGSALFETMKVANIVNRIKEHLDAGRKVVIYHRRVETKEPIRPPFEYMLDVANQMIKQMKPGKERDEFIAEANEFRQKHQDLLEWEKGLDYSMPREQLAKVFGEDNVLFFSGKESKKVKDKAVDTFNSDDSGKNILVIQEASGKEGISLHDTTGKHQRVVITLALPQSPITALQIEGRIYRIGNKSNAIFEYPILGLNSEMMLFGQKFNNQVSTTENLALGSQARNLRDSFAKGILEHSGIVPIDQQGVGGKEFDAPKEAGDSDPFDDAVLDYYSNQKLNKNNRQGVDYFPTPEPLGYKMVQWAGLGDGDSVLEPSAGHGAIARYVPKSNELVNIEPSQNLFARLQLKAGGLGRKFLNSTFENYDIHNKHDAVIMNPPFGKAGATAIQHLDKAFKHLDEGGRIVALIPRGSTDKKFEAWAAQNKDAVLRAEVNLPDITFQQAGTSVMCRVVVLDKVTDKAMRDKAGYPEKIDLSGHYDKVEDFFEDLRNIEMPGRIIDTNFKVQKKSRQTVKDIKSIKGVRSVEMNKRGITVKIKGDYYQYGMTFDGSEDPNFFKENMAGYYKQYDKLGKKTYYDDAQLAVFDELKKLSCKLAGMTEEEMQRFIKTEESNSGTHFREERGVQYSKTDAKDVKNSRIIPEDVDKNVSSQIEKKFDDEISSVYGDELTPEERNEVERIANLYRNTPIHDEYSKDENGNKRNHGGLESAIKTWERLATDFENYYGIERITRAKADGQGDGLNRGASELRSEGRIDGMGRRTGDIPAEDLQEYQRYLTNLASAKRALEYHNERTRVLEESYGVKRDEWLSQDTIEKIFKDFNSDKNLQTLFDRIKDQVKNLDVYFGEVYGSEKGLKGFYRHSYNDIRINLDSLSAFGKSKQDLASTILHEMLHPVTSDIISMYQDGHTDKLTSSQIEAAKEAVDLFNEIKNTFKAKGWEEPYALTNAREFFTELSSPEWRAALKKIKNGDSWWKRAIKSIVKMLGFKTSTNKLDEAEKVLDNLLSNFGKEQFDFAARHANELFKDKQFYKVTDKDELDRLNKEKTFRMYSGMQELDGKLYSPMAAIIDGKRTDATEMGAWMRSDERPDLVSEDGKFTLVKTDKPKGAGEGDVDAAYNPYMHTSTSMMNDQFTGAYARGNIKVVEWEIPESEKTSGYHAEKAKNSVGLVPWHSGSVNGLLPKDRQRSVMLSRWRKAVRLVPDSEVAESIAQQLKGTGLAIPWNVVTPNQLRELAKIGVPITTKESGTQSAEVKAKFEAQMEDLKKEFPQAKFVDVKMTKAAYKQWGKNGGTHFRDERPAVSIADDAPVVVKHVDKVAKQVGGKVKMVSSVDEITNKEAREAIEQGKNITGWYDEKTGEVHLYMPNIHDRYTAEKTIWHEVVGHKGLRGLFGDKFDDFLNSVWFDLDKPENATLKKLVMEEMKFNPFNRDNAIEEGLARLAEEGRGEQGFWNNIKNKVTDFLHEIGYRIAPNTKDVKYLLWLSKNLQKHPNDAYWKMRAEAVKYRLDHEARPAVKEHEGMFFGDDKMRSLENMTKAEYEEATDGEIHFRTTPSAATALDRYHKSLNEHGYMFTESYMDSMLSLKKLMQAIVPTAKDIADIKSSENPYILQNTMQGAMSNAAQMFERNVMQPLDKAMASVLDAFDGKKDDEKIKDFNIYMIMKHGLERNRVFFVRDYIAGLEKADADILQKQWNAEKKDLGAKLSSGIIDLKDYYERMDEWIRNNVDATFVAGEHDYSGFHGLDKNLDKSDPYNDDDIIATVMDKEASMESVKQGSVRDFWDKVKAATQYSLDCDYKNGLVTKENHDNASDMFDWYVPLRKYDEATAEDVYGYITEKGDPSSFIGPTLMKAKGRKSLSETNILAQIGAMGNSAINRGGKNAIKQAFARFIRNNGGQGLVTEMDVWLEKKGVGINGEALWEEVFPNIPEGASADEIARIVKDFEDYMNNKKAAGNAINMSKKGNIGFKFERAKDRSQHIVDVMIAGKKHSFIVNGNPRAAQALNGLLENSSAKGVMKPLGSISRMMAQLCTSFNPEFVMRNIMRDAEFASSNVTAKEGARYGAIWAKYYAQLGLYKGAQSISMKDFTGTTGLGLFAKYRNGTLDMNDKIQRYFKEFMENGGETGWVQIKNMKEWEKQYKQDVKAERSNIQKGGKMIQKFFFGNLENLNEVAENIARFSTYCASRDYGRSVVRSTYDAKEVSTNFNRHGSGDAIKSFKNGEMGKAKSVERWAYGFTSSYLRHCSMFFNAGIQSTNLLVKNLKTHPVGTSVNMLSIPFALGALAALGNNVLIASEDEKDRKGVKDPYGELPDYIRRNNLCIYKGGGEFVTIPLAIELRAFYGLGDLAAGLTFSPNVSGQKNPFFDGIGCMSQLVPVMDYLGNSSAGKDPLGETVKAITPSALSPFVEWEMNSDWKGSPIERRGDYNKDVPAWQRAYNGTPMKGLNKWVNAQTNDVAKGNEDMLGNGFLDMVTNPSMINHFFGGIGGGAATFTGRLVGMARNGKDTETKDIPFVRSLLYTPSEKTSLQRTKSKWYNYKDEMEVTMANVSRLKSKNVPLDKRLSNISDYFQFQDSKDAAKIRIIELADKQMNQWKKLRDRATDTQSVNFANQNIDQIMMSAVEELDKMD